jgi:hypothetical protein
MYHTEAFPTRTERDERYRILREQHYDVVKYTDSVVVEAINQSVDTENGECLMHNGNVCIATECAKHGKFVPISKWAVRWFVAWPPERIESVERLQEVIRDSTILA